MKTHRAVVVLVLIIVSVSCAVAALLTLQYVRRLPMANIIARREVEGPLSSELDETHAVQIAEQMLRDNGMDPDEWRLASRRDARHWPPNSGEYLMRSAARPGGGELIFRKKKLISLSP
jgi:hypothetical protein